MTNLLYTALSFLLLLTVTYGIRDHHHKEKHKHALWKKHHVHSKQHGNLKKFFQKTSSFKEIKDVDLFKNNSDENVKTRAEIERRTPQPLMDSQDAAVFNDFSANEPILWSNGPSARQTVNTESLNHSKQRNYRTKKGGDGEGPDATLPEGGLDGSHVTEGNPLKDFPNTAGANPNIYGGFPENDIWGNFELPAPETIDHLKLALKMNHHRPNYGGDQASDENDQLYGYEHHALPEYDILETPPFQEVMWQNAQLQEALKGGGKPACAPGMGSCPPVNNEAMCQNLHTACTANAQHPQDSKVQYETPCASKILELFGCGKKPEEKPPEEAKEDEPKKKPKPIPIPKKKKPEKEKPKEEKKIGEQLTSEDSGAKVTDNKLTEESLAQIMNKASEDQLHTENKNNEDTNLVGQSQARQSFHKGNHHSADESIDNSRIGLMNEEESLALMSAIGNDLQKSLAARFEQDEDEDKPAIVNHYKNKKHKSFNIDSTDQNATASFTGDKTDSHSDAKELTSYFETQKSGHDVTEGEKLYSDWSSWSKCNAECGEGTTARWRNCLKEKCEGSLREKKSCSKGRCAARNTASDKQRVKLKGLFETVSSGLKLPHEEVGKIIQSHDSSAMNQLDKDMDDKSMDETFQNVVSRFTNTVLNTSKPEETSDATIISDLLQRKLKTIMESDNSTTVNKPEVSTKHTEETKKMAEANWGSWGDCSRQCGVGHVTRMLQCESDGCMKAKSLYQTKPCRQKACYDPKLVSEIQENCLSLHNEFRRRHGAEPLEWSNELYKKAVEISDRVAMNDIPANNLTKYERPGLNLGYVSLTNVHNNKSETTPCARAIETWYGQKLNYNYDHPQVTTDDRDFTQIVWKSTKRIGISKSISADGETAYVAAVYEPPGNVDSYYDLKKNALPVRNATEEKTMEFLDKLLVNKKRKKSVTAKKQK